MDFEKVLLIYLGILMLNIILLCMEIAENRILRRENKRMQKILYWRKEE